MNPGTGIIRFALILFSILSYDQIIGQGCSDAGACSIGSMDEISKDVEPPRFKLSYDQNVGLGEKFTFISTTSLIVEHRFTKSSSFVVRVPFIFTSGNLGNTSGTGDVLVSYIQQLYNGQHTQLGILLGGKLRTNHSDFEFKDDPLPMAYQTSLGTYDIIGGFQFIYKTWDFYIAYQHPFGSNNNQYLHPEGETDENKLYYESAFLKRGDDLAVRVQKTFFLKNDQSLQPGILPIYRIQKSEITRNNQPEILPGSDGLTFNLFLTYSKKIRQNTIITLTAAFPVIDKDYRADGLTRNFVLSFRLTNMF